MKKEKKDYTGTATYKGWIIDVLPTGEEKNEFKWVILNAKGTEFRTGIEWSKYNAITAAEEAIDDIIENTTKLNDNNGNK